MRKSRGPQLPEVRAKISAAQKGKARNWSPEGRARVQAAQFKTGVSISKPEGFGDKMSRIQRDKNGGLPLDPRQCREYFTFRLAVLTRDGFVCQFCSVTEATYKEQQTGNKIIRGLDVHHIQSWDTAPKLRFEVNNGKASCLPCHMREERKLNLDKVISAFQTPEARAKRSASLKAALSKVSPEELTARANKAWETRRQRQNA